MSQSHADRERVPAGTRAEWRRWLDAHHGSSPGAWLVSWRKHTGKPAIPYADAVEEALRVGWVDSLGRKLDDRRTMLYFAPRKPGSGWSRPNKQRVQRLLAAGDMGTAGLRVVEAAKRDGSWTMLDEVEDLVVPDDLAAAFDRHPGSRTEWDGFPRSPRRAILEWIVQAKKPETRAKRIEEAARLAALGERANEWRRRS